MTGAPDPRHEVEDEPMTDRTPRGPTGTTTCIVQRRRAEGHTGTLKCAHGSSRGSRHRRGVMGGGCELYISKVLTALRHHDTPRHLRRGTVSESKLPVGRSHSHWGWGYSTPKTPGRRATHTDAVSTRGPLDPLTRNQLDKPPGISVIFFRIPFASPTCAAAASCCVWCTKNDLALVNGARARPSVYGAPVARGARPLRP